MPFWPSFKLKKEFILCSLLSNNGINPIPHVYAVNQYQANRWIIWFKQNPNVKVFTINCQMQKSNTELQYLSSFIKRILIELPYLHLILQGYKQTGIRLLNGFLERIHFADKKANKYSIGYKNIIYDNSAKKEKIVQEKPLKSMSKNDIIINNILARERYFTNI